MPRAHRISRNILGAVLLVTAAPAVAHPEAVGGFVNGMLHPLSGLDHVLAGVAIGALAARLGSRRDAVRLCVAVLAALALAFVLGVAGPSLGSVEPLLVLSVVALPALAFIAHAMPLPACYGLAALLGSIHGYAHGLEAPSAATPVGFGGGFLLATAALLLVGALLYRAGSVSARALASRT